MKKIGLTRGFVALVDDQDFEFLSKWKWHVQQKRDSLYAARTSRKEEGGNRRSIGMHMALLPDSIEVDHIDGNGLNNQRHNLRRSTRRENSFNSKKSRRRSSRFKGVSWDRFKNKWKAQIAVSGQNIPLGRFMSEVEAAVAYDAAALIHFGSFARLNHPENSDITLMTDTTRCRKYFRG